MTMEDNLKSIFYLCPPWSGSVVVGTETQWCPLQLNKLGSDQFRVSVASCSQPGHQAKDSFPRIIKTWWLVLGGHPTLGPWSLSRPSWVNILENKPNFLMR